MRDNSQSYNSILKFAWGMEPVKYKVSADILFINGKETQKHTLHYDLRMQVIGYQGNQPAIQIEKKNQAINNKKPDTIIDELTLETAEVISRINLGLDDKGRVKSLFNFEEITDRWQSMKEKTMERYPGEAIEGFLGVLEKSLETPEKLLLAFKRDPILYNFFSGIYTNYGIAQKLNDTFKSGNLVPGIDLNFITEKRWKDLPDNKAEITETGELQTETIDKEQLIKAINTRTKQNIVGYNQITGNMEIKTNVTIETGSIHSHKSTISIQIDDLKIENSINVTNA